MFAAPHGLSQRTTSFIASQRQGIHRIPLRHLIALIVDARRGLQSQLKALKLGTDRKDQLTSWTHSSSPPPRCGRVPFGNDDCVTSSRFENNTRRTPEGIPSNLRGTSSTAGFSSIRSLIDCDTRPLSCPVDGGARRDRTDDLLLAKQALSQLSYGPRYPRFEGHLVGLGQLERPTSPLSGVRSNHLSYRPVDRASHIARKVN